MAALTSSFDGFYAICTNLDDAPGDIIRVETLFSQLTDQFLVIRNYAKITNGSFARIIGKISALTILQYVNFINNRPIGRIKYALN